MVRWGLTVPPTTKGTKMATRKTPAERAQDEFDTAKRVLEKATDRETKAREAYTKAAGDLKAAQKRVAFLGTHPDLPGNDVVPAAIEPEPTASAPVSQSDDDRDVL